ncbi:hypothetical protein ES703_81535 [subsurface metagenome]
MGPSIHGVNTVSEAKGGFGKAIIILKGCLNYGAIYYFGGIDRLAVADLPVAVKVANEASNSTLKVEGLLVVFPFILERYFQPLI